MGEDRLTRQDWVRAGLKALARNGVNALKADVLARELGVSRGSFYWHFTDVTAFHLAVLEAWEEATTAQVIDTVEALQGSVPEKLHLLAQTAFATEGALERQVRAWASQNVIAEEVQERVDQTRMAFVTRLSELAGMDRQTAQLRSKFFYLALVGRFATGKRFELAAEEITKMVDLLMEK